MGTVTSLQPRKYQTRTETPWPGGDGSRCFCWTSFGRRWDGKRNLSHSGVIAAVSEKRELFVNLVSMAAVGLKERTLFFAAVLKGHAWGKLGKGTGPGGRSSHLLQLAALLYPTCLGCTCFPGRPGASGLGAGGSTEGADQRAPQGC